MSGQEAATALGAAWIKFYRPGMSERETKAFKAAWRLRGEADRAAVDGFMENGQRQWNASLARLLAAIAALDEQDGESNE